MDFQLILGTREDDLRPTMPSTPPADPPADEPTPRETLRAFGRAATREPADPDYDFLVGTALLRAGDLSRASERLADAVRLDRANPDYALALGCAYWYLGRFEDAEASFREAAERWPAEVFARNARGAALVRLGRTAEAADVFQALLASDRSLVEAHSNLGVALWQLGRREEAVARWRLAARLGVERPEPARNLGLALRSLGRADEAFEALRTAAARAPGAASPLLDLAEAACEAGRPEEAEAAFEAASRLDPRSVESRPSSLAARDALRRARLPKPREDRSPLDPLGHVFATIAAVEAAFGRIPWSPRRLVGPVLTAATLIAAAAALRVVPPYVDHYLLRDDLAVVARAPVEDDAQVRDRLAHAIRERGLDGVVEADRCEVQTRTGWRRITCAYVVPLEILPGMASRRLSFRIDVEQAYVLPRGGD